MRENAARTTPAAHCFSAVKLELYQAKAVGHFAKQRSEGVLTDPEEQLFFF